MDTLLLSILACTLTLTPALKLTELKVPTKVTAGETATLDCIFDLEGDDLYSVKWYKDNKEFYRFLPSDVPRRQLYPVEGINVSLNGDSNSSVILNNVSRPASGRYICEISCDAPSFKTVSFSEYLHVVENPDPPQHLHVIETTSRSVTLAWTESPAGNDVITNYVIQHKEHGSNWNFNTVNTTVPEKRTTFVVSELEPLTTYDFRVLAESGLGRSNASDLVTATTSMEAPGGPPTNVSARALDVDSVKVTWKAPSEDSRFGKIRGYYVGYRPQAGPPYPYVYKSVEHDDQGSEECILTSLSPSTAYGVIVKAVNDQGAGPPSAEIVVETLRSGPPTPPQLSVVNTSATSVLLEWKRPTSDANPVQGYYVTYRKAESGHGWEKTHVPGNQRSLAIDKLNCGSTYLFAARAYNDAGIGDISNIVTAKTKGTSPVVLPGARSAVVPDRRSAVILTSAWQDGGCPIDNFTAVVTSEDPGYVGSAVSTTRKAEQPNDEPVLKVGGLLPAHEYKVLVTAYNEAGGTTVEYKFTTLPDRREKPPEVRVPPFGLLGDMVYLYCSYGSENAETQTVTWLKDGEEFYQFSPRREPSVMTFDVKGVNVNIELSNGSTVCLEKLSSWTAGTYSCEVSSEQPLFRSTAGGNLAIVERLPATPRISASIAGDEVQVTCIGVHSKPHPTLYLFIDDRLSNSTTTVRGDIDGLFTASLRATTTVGKPGAEGVQVRVRCEALFSDAYSATVEKTIRIEPRWRLLSRASFPKDRCTEKALAVFSKVWMAFAEVQEASAIHEDSFELFQ